MTDLFTPPMPTTLEDRYTKAVNELWAAADAADDFLEGFLGETWAECHRTHTVTHQGKTLEVPGTPDFNEFDRQVGKYQKAANKLRHMLWDIHEAARSAEPQGDDA